ncbi:TolC family protein [Bernardetia sp. Wsw4-3y2]|uniref:TolC family protein n=1 Tax=Bernardetia sp. Wsw4-3y2 TaxID=3127471 RepID=UPI0030D1A657
MKTYFISFCVFGSLLFNQIKAQDTTYYTLDEAVKVALQNNKSVEAAELDTELNRFRKGEANSALYPQINGSAGITHFIDLPQSFLPAQLLNPQAPDGEVVGAALGLPNTSKVGISANWLLYNQAVFAANKILRVQSELSEVQIQQTKDEVAYSVTQLYYGISFAIQQKSILSKNVESLDKLLKIVESNYQNGLITKVEVGKVSVSKSNLESELENIEVAIQTQQNFLRLLMGLPTDAKIKLTDTFGNQDFQKNLVQNIDLFQKVENTTDYKLLQKQIQLTQAEKQTFVASYIPSLAIVYDYSYNWANREFSNLYNSDLKYPQQYVGVQLNVPIFDGRKNEYKLRQNKVKTLQLEKRADYLNQKIATDITNANLKYNQNITAISVREQNRQVAKQVYEQSLLQYQEGIISLNDVITSENEWRQAQTQYLTALSNTLLALLDYKKATGNLLSMEN